MLVRAQGHGRLPRSSGLHSLPRRHLHHGQLPQPQPNHGHLPQLQCLRNRQLIRSQLRRRRSRDVEDLPPSLIGECLVQVHQSTCPSGEGRPSHQVNRLLFPVPDVRAATSDVLLLSSGSVRSAKAQSVLDVLCVQLVFQIVLPSPVLLRSPALLLGPETLGQMLTQRESQSRMLASLLGNPSLTWKRLESLPKGYFLKDNFVLEERSLSPTSGRSRDNLIMWTQNLPGGTRVVKKNHARRPREHQLSKVECGWTRMHAEKGQTNQSPWLLSEIIQAGPALAPRVMLELAVGAGQREIEAVARSGVRGSNTLQCHPMLPQISLRGSAATHRRATLRI